MICRMFLRNKGMMAFHKYEDIPSLGRFVLRDENRAVGLGKILKYRTLVARHTRSEVYTHVPGEENRLATEVLLGNKEGFDEDDK